MAQLNYACFIPVCLHNARLQLLSENWLHMVYREILLTIRWLDGLQFADRLFETCICSKKIPLRRDIFHQPSDSSLLFAVIGAVAAPSDTDTCWGFEMSVFRFPL